MGRTTLPLIRIAGSFTWFQALYGIQRVVGSSGFERPAPWSRTRPSFGRRQFYDINVSSLRKRPVKLHHMLVNTLNRERFVCLMDWPQGSFSFLAKNGRGADSHSPYVLHCGNGQILPFGTVSAFRWIAVWQFGHFTRF
jgi:hypothetical protein